MLQNIKLFNVKFSAGLLVDNDLHGLLFVH